MIGVPDITLLLMSCKIVTNRYDAEIPAKFSDEKVWPKHILTQKWIPQNDLLGHSNTVLFIGHCGSSSQFEVVFKVSNHVADLVLL